MARRASGEIAELPPDTRDMWQYLIKLDRPESTSAGTANQSVPVSVPSVKQISRTFSDALMNKPKDCHITAADVRQIPRLDGSSDADVPRILEQYRLTIALEVKSVHPDESEFADKLAFTYFSLTYNGQCHTVLDQLMSGQMDWTAGNVSSDDTRAKGSFTPLAT